MTDVDLEKLLEPRTKDLQSIAESLARGERGKVADGLANLAITLATGNPILGALAPLARKGIAKAFGNSADEMFARELANMKEEEARREFLGQIDEVVAALLGQALIQLVRTQHNVKDEVLAALGGVREDFAQFRADFQSNIARQGEAVNVAEQIVRTGAVGVRVRPTTTQHVTIGRMEVVGEGAIGIILE